VEREGTRRKKLPSFWPVLYVILAFFVISVLRNIVIMYVRYYAVGYLADDDGLRKNIRKTNRSARDNFYVIIFAGRIYTRAYVVESSEFYFVPPLPEFRRNERFSREFRVPALDGRVIDSNVAPDVSLFCSAHATLRTLYGARVVLSSAGTVNRKRGRIAGRFFGIRVTESRSGAREKTPTVFSRIVRGRPTPSVQSRR